MNAPLLPLSSDTIAGNMSAESRPVACSYSFTCPGGVIGALFRDARRDGHDLPQEMITKIAAEDAEWAAAGLAPGQWATRLPDGRLVAAH